MKATQALLALSLSLVGEQGHSRTPSGENPMLGPCLNLLNAYGECTLAFRRDQDDGQARCAGYAGPSVLSTCLVIEAEALGDRTDQVQALRFAASKSPSVSRLRFEGYGLKASQAIVRVCQDLVRLLPSQSAVRRAVLTSVFRTAQKQRDIINSGNKYAVAASSHSLGLACDIQVSGYRTGFPDVVAEAERLVRLAHPKLSRHLRFYPEPGISVIHIEPNYETKVFRQERVARIRALIRAGILPSGTPDNVNPPFTIFSDVAPSLARR